MDMERDKVSKWGCLCPKILEGGINPKILEGGGVSNPINPLTATARKGFLKIVTIKELCPR